MQPEQRNETALPISELVAVLARDMAEAGMTIGPPPIPDETLCELARGEWVEERVNALQRVLAAEGVGDPSMTYALGNYRRALDELARLGEVVQAWLDDTDEADEDDPVIHDFYVRVGARWGKGNYYRRFKEALDGIS